MHTTSDTSLDIWHKGYTPRGGSILETEHGQRLAKMVEGLEDLRTIDLGCGNQAASEIFKNYTGVDLPTFDIYNHPVYFLEEYELVLMNAFIDVMEYPLSVLDTVLASSRHYVAIHRQEFTYGNGGISKEDAYGGWTWHSKVNWKEFLYLAFKHNFEIRKIVNLTFPNWEAGGTSVLLQHNDSTIQHTTSRDRHLPLR